MSVSQEENNDRKFVMLWDGKPYLWVKPSEYLSFVIERHSNRLPDPNKVVLCWEFYQKIQDHPSILDDSLQPHFDMLVDILRHYQNPTEGIFGIYLEAAYFLTVVLKNKGDASKP